jgi:predicted permease
MRKTAASRMSSRGGLVWRVLERRLGRYLPPDRITPILGDLSADYEECARRRGHLRARIWLLGEALSLVAAYRRHAPKKRGLMDKLRSDLMHAWRTMRARPTAAVGTIAVLALGIGLVSAMFALADPYVTRPLPWPDADRLVTLSVRTRATTDVPTIEGLRARTDLFASLAATGSTETVNASGPDAAITLRLQPVSRDYFDVLRTAMPPVVEWRRHADSTETPVLLTAGASRRLRASGVPGAALRLADDTGAATGRGYRVRDVLAPSFLFPSSSQIWDGFVPLPDGAALVEIDRTPAGFAVSRVALSPIARLQPGVTLEQVEAALRTAPPEDSPVMPSRGQVVMAHGVQASMTARLRPLATAALGAGVLVLLVCAANVANLLMARGAFRRRELATREALGASGLDLGRLVLVEVGLLAALGVAGGLAVADAVLRATAGLIPAQYVMLGTPEISSRVIGLACLAGVVIVGAGLLPALAAWRMSAAALVNQMSTGEPRRVRVARFAMTAVQTAVAVVLLVGAMLMARSYVNLLTQDPGYAGDLFAVGVQRRGEPGGSWRAEVDTTVDRLRRIPGVASAAAVKGTLVENIGMGFAAPAVYVDGQRVRGLIKSVGTGFFQTTGTSLLEGRLLTPADENRSAVVSDSMAKICCADGTAIGRRVSWTELSTERSVERSVEIVGVVKDVFDVALDRLPTPAAFIPFGDRDQSAVWTTYVVRVNRATPSLAAAVERDIHAVNPRVTIADGGLMRDRLMRSIQDRSFATLIVTFFGLAAIGVSAAGLVGVVGFVVARRTRELAIRMAIGAGTADVLWLVTREAATASAVGAVLGLITGGWVSRTMESFLYGVSPADPGAMALAAVALVAIVAVAAWVPARRAVRLSPSLALRVE